MSAPTAPAGNENNFVFSWQMHFVACKGENERISGSLASLYLFYVAFCTEAVIQQSLKLP